MLWLAAMALVAGTGGAFSAWALIHLIALVTNLVWFGRLSAVPVSIGDSTLVGLIARRNLLQPRAQHRRNEHVRSRSRQQPI